jgi:hypothetical protein
MIVDPNPKNGHQKTLYCHFPKINALALHTVSLELGLGSPVKSRKFHRKIDFFGKIFEKRKKILRLKTTRKKFSKRWTNKIDNRFRLLKFLISYTPGTIEREKFLGYNLKIINIQIFQGTTIYVHYVYCST